MKVLVVKEELCCFLLIAAVTTLTLFYSHSRIHFQVDDKWKISQGNKDPFLNESKVALHFFGILISSARVFLWMHSLMQ